MPHHSKKALGTHKGAAKEKQTRPIAEQAKPTQSPEDVLVVGVGASAGGQSAFRTLLSHFSKDSDMALVLITHLAPNYESILTELLAKNCPMPIHKIIDGMVIENSHVYVIPPNHQLVILHNRLHLAPLAEGPHRYKLVDVFFQSLADDRASRAIGVVLSGAGSDGTLGCRAIKAAGGITFAQDSESAEFDGMPSSAVAAGCVDFVLPPAQIAQELSRLARSCVIS